MSRLIKVSFFFVLLSGCLVADGQKGIEGLINVEKNFAAYSVAHGAKEAFLNFLDSAGIVFDNGKPVNGIDAWKKREKRSGVLNWHPQFAEIAESGDFGYTTGPWTFQNSPNDSVAARGQYTTVWHINKSEEWKFLVDLGVANTPVNPQTEVKMIDVAKQFLPEANSKGNAVVDAEKKFLKAVSKNRPGAYKKYLSVESILNRNGCLPAIAVNDQQKLIDATPSSIRYEVQGSGASAYRDIGYVYGTTTINGKTENYLRIWRWEKNGWKIALEVLRY